MLQTDIRITHRDLSKNADDTERKQRNYNDDDEKTRTR